MNNVVTKLKELVEHRMAIIEKIISEFIDDIPMNEIMDRCHLTEVNRYVGPGNQYLIIDNTKVLEIGEIRMSVAEDDRGELKFKCTQEFKDLR